MRINYFGYYVKNRGTGQRYFVNLQNFIRDFIKSKDVIFKSQFTYNTESILLLPLEGSTHLFVQARDLEIVKRIRRSQWTADDIKNILQQGQSVGFASYLYLQDCWFATACRLMSPRHTAFAHLVNSLFEALGIPYIFVIRPFKTQLSESEVINLQRVGKISIELSTASPILSQILDLITGGDGEDLMDVASLRLSIVPQRKRDSDLQDNLQAIVESLPKHGLARLEARAKVEAADRMSDIYICGEGAIHDFLDVDDEAHIPGAIASLSHANPKLKEIIEEFREDEDVATDHTASELGINWSHTHGPDMDGNV